LSQQRVELRVRAPLQIAFELPDLPADLALLGAELVRLRMRRAALLVRGAPGIDQFRRADALLARGVYHGVGIFAEQLRIEHRKYLSRLILVGVGL
jgi:hypothetical protein